MDVDKVHYVPYPYIPVPGFLKIPADTQTNVIIFIGRLETRKGILDLAEAIPQVLRRFPKAKFCFVGPSESSPNPDLNMQQYLERALSSFRRSIEFVGSIPTAHIPHLLAKSDICVIPSLWDNFPCVCLEAMAAARGIVATHSGGISDMISHRQLGLLVPPHQPKQLVEAIVELLESPHLRIHLGLAARQRLTTEYSSERIGPLQEASYARAIARRTLLGTRQQGNASGDFYA